MYAPGLQVFGLIIREVFLFFVPVSPPIYFVGSIITIMFLDERYLNSIFLSGRVCEQHERAAEDVHSYEARLSEVYVFMYCALVYTTT